MAKASQQGTSPQTVISIIGPGMKVVGDLNTEGTVRIEGEVHGNVHAGKAVVVGKDGVVGGDIHTQDAVIAGRVTGTMVIDSRLELQPSCRVEGEIRARRMQLEEGAEVIGSVQIGEAASRSSGASTSHEPREAVGAQPQAPLEGAAPHS